MEILQLKYFCDAAETENFSKTANKYSVPASNISQSVSRLEKEVRVKLFDRSANKITLNEQGKAFHKRIKKALECIEEAKTVLNDTGVSGEIRIKICTNRRIVTEIIEKFKGIFPEVTFTLSHDHKQNGVFDLIISDDIAVNRNLKSKILVKENIILAAKKDSSALNCSNISELENERFITMPEGSSQFEITKKLCERAGFVPNITIQSDDPYYIRKYVSMGLGIAFVPEFSWKGQFENNVECKDIAGFVRDTFVFWDDEKYMTKAVKEFLQMLSESVLYK